MGGLRSLFATEGVLVFSAFSGQVGVAGQCVGLGLVSIERLVREEPPLRAVLLFLMLSWFLVLCRMSSSSPALRSLSEDRTAAVLWGCELGVNSQSCVVKEDDDFLEHLVLLRTISLGADARDELHVVAVESKNTYGDHKPVPIASLRVSVLPMISLKGLEFVPPVTFMLQCGTGPVYLSGQHVTLEDVPRCKAHEEELVDMDEGDEDDARAARDGE
ncbi:nucleoplasmin-like [Phasianus colchicus]|uniref:nucleoplasmin-like n=1 Tax=Phasianus colchicus TaxID=9054 RepID=UPI00129DB3A0|nr:nucleoplasmin-like [Phasianus colchicus]